MLEQIRNKSAIFCTQIVDFAGPVTYIYNTPIHIMVPSSYSVCAVQHLLRAFTYYVHFFLVKQRPRSCQCSPYHQGLLTA